MTLVRNMKGIFPEIRVKNRNGWQPWPPCKIQKSVLHTSQNANYSPDFDSFKTDHKLVHSAINFCIMWEFLTSFSHVLDLLRMVQSREETQFRVAVCRYSDWATSSILSGTTLKLFAEISASEIIMQKLGLKIGMIPQKSDWIAALLEC